MQTIKDIVKAAKDRGDWDKKSKECMLTDDELSQLEGMEWPVIYGKRKATLYPAMKRLQVVMDRGTRIDEAAREHDPAYDGIPQDAQDPEEPQQLSEEEEPEQPPEAKESEQEQLEIEFEEDTTAIRYLKASTDILLWVGHTAYPTIDLFIDEVTRLGVLKGFKKKPTNFVEGESRIIFAHDEGFEGNGVIVGYCIPEFKKGGIDTDEEPPSRRDRQIADDPNRLYATGKFIPTKGLIDISGTPKRKGHPFIDGTVLERTNFVDSPSSRITEPREAKTSARWTDEERQELKDLVAGSEGTFAAFREFAAKSGRTVRSIEYQWYHTMKKGEA